MEYGGKRILFDTGNNPDILAHNAEARGIDLAKLDFVVMSHRHGDDKRSNLLPTTRPIQPLAQFCHDVCSSPNA